MSPTRPNTSGLFTLLLAAIAILALTACQSGGSGAVNQAEVIRVAFFPNVTHAQPIVGLKQGFFQQQLGDIRIDTKQFNAGPLEIEALFAGEIDVGYVGPSPATTGYMQSSGAALRIIAGSSSGGASLVVGSDAGINTPADLKGKRIASPQLGNTQDIALRSYLKEQGLRRSDQGGDVQVIPISNPNIATLFQKKDLDAAWVPEPWATRLIRDGGGKLFIDERTLWPDGKFATTVVIVRKDFLDRNPALVKQWLEGHVRTTQWINQNSAEAQTVLRQELDRITGSTVKPEVIADAFSRTDFLHDPLEATIRKTAQAAIELGFIKDRVSLENLVSLALLNEVLAAAELPQITK